jgi:hypothetical protein
VTDYGQVVAMAADVGLFSFGAAGGTSLSAPAAPGGGTSGGSTPTAPGGSEGGGNLGENVAGGGGGGGTEGSGGVGGAGGGGGGTGTVSGAELGGGAGGERGNLPFSGFPAALVAAVGGALTATGAALARAVRRDR